MKLINIAIKTYQILISPFLGSNCRFTPSCSHYLAEAVKTRGWFTGLALGMGRLLRCQPFFAGGWDPVPQHPRKDQA